MLTSVYYFNFYKPYIFSTRETDNVSPRRNRIADRKQSPPVSSKDFVLNKAVKDEIVNFAKDVSSGINNLRSSARRASYDMERFNHLVYKDGWDSAVSSLKKDFIKFADQYNASTDFLQQQERSSDLRTFSNEITDHLRYNRERLGSLGFSFSEEGRMSYDRSVVEGMSHNRINAVIGDNMRVFNEVQRHAEGVLKEPLVEHMNFRGLGYHYNYKLGMMKADGFNLLEVGLLINEAV
jgi:hypothetical protein